MRTGRQDVHCQRGNAVALDVRSANGGHIPAQIRRIGGSARQTGGAVHTKVQSYRIGSVGTVTPKFRI